MRLQNGEDAVQDWKLHIWFPHAVPIRTQNIEQLDDVSFEGKRYASYQISGAKIYRGENLELVGIGKVSLAYDITDEIYRAGRDTNMLFRWTLYLSSGGPLQGSVPWMEMHEF
ncbi:hypothetical protein [Stenotrophobium rhamnosiphilum]|nr:hypothetical protein [Stenotrophobium rhamnosiphilum]